MYVMDLFSGIGGGILASQLLGHQVVCAVESDPYCQCVLVQRQNDKLFPSFPIWDDICTFNGKEWNGSIDMVQGGFPCQNISQSGDRTGINGTKSKLWFEMLRIIREVRPKFTFIENSQKLTVRGLDTILCGLAEVGYDAEWMVLGADDCGAPHQRKRMWILAKRQEFPNSESSGLPSTVRESGRPTQEIARTCNNRTDVPNSDCQRELQPQGNIENKRGRIGNICQKISNTGNKRNVRRNRKFENYKNIIPKRNNYRNGKTFDDIRKWWEVEPAVGRVADGIPHRIQQLNGLGNAQVPIVAAMAFTILFNRINESF
jgi:DNA (cytosine-5)-methyltransferase 1